MAVHGSVATVEWNDDDGRGVSMTNGAGVRRYIERYCLTTIM